MKSEFTTSHTFQSLKAELEKVKSKEKEVMERMEEDAKDLEKMASKQTLLHQKIEDCSKKIRDLGSLPSEAFDKYQVSVKFPDIILHQYTSSIFCPFIQAMLFLEILSQSCNTIVKKRIAFQNVSPG